MCRSGRSGQGVGREPLLLIAAAAEKAESLPESCRSARTWPRHMEGVRDVGDEAGRALIGVPRLSGIFCLRRRGSGNDARRTAHRLWRPPLRAARRFHRVFARLLGGRFEAVVDREPSIDWFKFGWILGDEPAQRGDVRRIGGIAVARGAAARLRLMYSRSRRRSPLASAIALAIASRARISGRSRCRWSTGHGVRAGRGAAAARAAGPLAGSRSSWTPGGSRSQDSGRWTSRPSPCPVDSSACVQDVPDS